MAMETPSVAVVAILERPPPVLSSERYRSLGRDDDMVESLESGTMVNPLIVAAATNQPQIPKTV
jgi:hypothetical protein